MLELVQNKLRLKNRPKCLLKSFVFFLHQRQLIFLFFFLSFIVALHCSSYWSSKSYEEKVWQLWQRDWTWLWRQQEGQHWLFDVFIQWVCIYILLLVVEYCTVWTGTVPHLWVRDNNRPLCLCFKARPIHVSSAKPSYLVLFNMSYEYKLLYGGCCCCCCCLFWGTIMRPYCNCMGYGLLYGGCFAVAVAAVVVVVVVVWLWIYEMSYCMADVFVFVWLLLLSVDLFGEGIRNYHRFWLYGTWTTVGWQMGLWTKKFLKVSLSLKNTMQN